eukprot:scaffold8887_cov56-Attheya_sp.AAC.3
MPCSVLPISLLSASPPSELPASPDIPLDPLLKKYVHDDLDKVPPVHPCDTPDSSVVGSLRTTPESLHKVFGCRWFKSYGDFACTHSNLEFVNAGEPAPTLGDFATIPKSPRNKEGLPVPNDSLMLSIWTLAMVTASVLGGFDTSLFWSIGALAIVGCMGCPPFLATPLSPLSKNLNWMLAASLNACIQISTIVLLLVPLANGLRLATVVWQLPLQIVRIKMA